MIIDYNDKYKKFDFRSVITTDDNNSACDIIASIINTGNYFTNSPKYQTKENLFQRNETLWLKFRMSFLFSVFMYLGREVKASNLQAWSFMTNLEGAEDREKLWHTHWHPSTPNSKIMSGIWYLHIPDDVYDIDTCGTEIAPNGVEHEERIFVTPTMYHWLIYPGDTWHRPGIVQSNKYRFVLAADVEYIL